MNIPGMMLEILICHMCLSLTPDGLSDETKCAREGVYANKYLVFGR